MNRIAWTGIIAVLAAGMAFGQGMDPKSLAEAQKAANEKELKNSRAVFQDQLRRTETRGTTPVTFGNQNTVDVGEIAVEPQPAASPGAGNSVTLRGTAIPQVDHNALVDRTKYNIVLEVVDDHDRYTQYAVRINDISRQHIARYRGGTGVAITGSVEAEGDLKVITPTRIELLPRPIKP